MLRFDKFSESAQSAVQQAVEILQRYGQNQVDTEHVLIALLEQPEGSVPQLLEGLNISPSELSERLDYALRTSTKANIYGGGAGQIFITPNVRRAVDQAYNEARRMGDEYIAPEHIFLAILNEKNSNVSRILEEMNLTRVAVLEQILKAKGESSAIVPEGEKPQDPPEKSR